MNNWIPLKTRPMSNEEKEIYSHFYEVCNQNKYLILDCPLPKDGKEVLISSNGYVGIDILHHDDSGCYFESCYIDDVDAWIPLPKPYVAN